MATQGKCINAFLSRSLVVALLLIMGGCATSAPRSSDMLDLMRQAEKQYREGRLTSAEASYRKILATNPDAHQAWLKLGNIYIRTGQLEAAILAYENCAQKQNDDIRCWNNLALARVKQGIAALEKAQAHFVPGTADHNRLIAFYGSLVRTISSNNR